MSTAAWVKESDLAMLVPSTLWAGTLGSHRSVFFMLLSLCCRTQIFCNVWMKTSERTKTRLTTYCQHKYQQKLSEAVTLFFSVNCSSNSFILFLSACYNVDAACLSCSTTSKPCTRFNNSSQSTFIFSNILKQCKKKKICESQNNVFFSQKVSVQKYWYLRCYMNVPDSKKGNMCCQIPFVLL